MLFSFRSLGVLNVDRISAYHLTLVIFLPKKLRSILIQMLAIDISVCHSTRYYIYTGLLALCSFPLLYTTLLYWIRNIAIRILMVAWRSFIHVMFVPRCHSQWRCVSNDTVYYICIYIFSSLAGALDHSWSVIHDA